MIDPADLTNAVPAVLLAAVAAGNPARRVATLPPGVTGPLAAAALVAAVPLLVLGWASGAVLDALAVSPPTARLAAGLVLVVVGLAGVVSTGRALEVRDPGIVVPLAFPLLLRPELALVVLVGGADHGAAGGTAATVAGLALTPLLAVAVARSRPGSREVPVGPDSPVGPVDPLGPIRPIWLEGLGRVLAASGVLVGVGLVLDGVFAL